MTWVAPITQFNQLEDGRVEFAGIALHAGSYRNGSLNFTPDMIQKSAKSFEGVDLMAGHPALDNPGDPTKICGDIKIALAQDGNLHVRGITDQSDLGKHQALQIQKGKLQFSIGGKPVFLGGRFDNVQGDHVALLRKGHAEDKKTFAIAMSSTAMDEIMAMQAEADKSGSDNDEKIGQEAIHMGENDKDKPAPKGAEDYLQLKQEIEIIQAERAAEAKEKQKLHLAALVTMIAGLLQFATLNKLEDHMITLKELKPENTTTVELKGIEVDMLKLALENQTGLASQHKQNQINMGAPPEAGAGSHLTMAGMTDQQMLQMNQGQIGADGLMNFYHPIRMARRQKITPELICYMLGKDGIGKDSKEGKMLQLQNDYQVEGVPEKGGYMTSPELAQEIIDAAREATYLRDYFEYWPMGANIRNIPKILGGLRSIIKFMPEATSYGDSQTFVAGNVALKAHKLMAQMRYSTELDEDWAVSGSPGDKIIEMLGQAYAEALEWIAIFGNQTTWDPDNPATRDQGALGNGIIKQCPAEHIIDMANAEITEDAIRRAMAFIADSKSTPAAMMGPPQLIRTKVNKLKNSETNVLRLPDGFRRIENRTAIFDGADVLESGFLPYTDQGAGLFTGDLLLWGNRAFAYGSRRELKFHQRYDEDYDAEKITTTGRWGLQDLTNADDATSRVAMVINCKVSA